MTNFGYSPKVLDFDKEGQDKLINGITTIAKAVINDCNHSFTATSKRSNHTPKEIIRHRLS